jgi:Abnormal spindle-like microcephaly-assoc'd, ASPM-SPD-2-Hydin
MKLRIACLAVGFCLSVLAIAAQNSGSTTSTSPAPRLLNISGTALSNSDLKPFPASLNFGTVTIDTTSTIELILANEGKTALNITKIAISGLDAQDFSQTNQCEGVLPRGGSCGVSVRFRPTGSGTRAAALTVNDNPPPAGRLEVSLSGVGKAGSCAPYGAPCRLGITHCCARLVCAQCGEFGRPCCQ